MKFMISFSRSYTSSKIIKSISSFKSVSFDIFDTLVKRSFASPNDVFFRVSRDYSQLTGHSVNSQDFLRERYSAADRAYTLMKEKDQSREELTLSEIYSQMKDGELLMRLEAQREIKCCRANPELKRVYDWCISNNKRVFIISDMYLELETVSEILRVCGYSGYEKLYLSSDAGLTKHTGRLFTHFIENSGINPKTHIHIGDSARCDYLRALQAGLHSCKIARHLRRSKYPKISGLNPKHKSHYLKLQEVINNHINPSWNEYYLYGFEVIGPLLYGLVCWLHERFLEGDYGKIFFLSRDGYIMQKAYNTLLEDRALPASYLYVSRDSLRSSQLWLNPEPEDILALWSPLKVLDAGMLCSMMNIDMKEGLNFWRDCGLSASERRLKGELLADERVMKFFAHFRDEMMTRSREGYDVVTAYLEQEGFRGKAATVDIGWAGSIQKYLSIYTKGKADITGYYLGLKQGSMKGYKAHSFIPESINTSSFCASLLEYPFTKLEGSVKTYTINEAHIVIPVLHDYDENSEDCKIIAAIHDGALHFIRLMRDSYGFEHVDYSVAYAKLRRLSRNPTLREAIMMGDLVHGHIASPRSIAYYMPPPYYVIYEETCSTLGGQSDSSRDFSNFPCHTTKCFRCCENEGGLM